MTPTVKSGIAPANFAMTDWESFDVRFGSKADLAWIRPEVRFTPKADITGRECQVRFVPEADIPAVIQSPCRPGSAASAAMLALARSQS